VWYFQNELTVAIIALGAEQNLGHHLRPGFNGKCAPDPTISIFLKFDSTSCNMWFQRVTEVGEAEEDMPERGVMEGSFNGREQFNKLPPKRSGSLLSPADFQRVRMLRKINRWTAIRIMAAGSAARGQKEGRGEDEQKRDQPSPNLMMARAAKKRVRLHCFRP
jgi:hypothetical protein